MTSTFCTHKNLKATTQHTALVAGCHGICNDCGETIWWVVNSTVAKLEDLMTMIEVNDTLLIDGKTWVGWFAEFKRWDGRFAVVEALVGERQPIRTEFRVDWRKINVVIRDPLFANGLEHMYPERVSWEALMSPWSMIEEGK